MIGRAMRRRCPLCGQGHMFTKWVRMRDYCDSCGFRFDRNQPDYFIGAYTINLIVSELIVVGILVSVMFLTWPEVPWSAIQWGLVALMIPAPILMYPYSKSLWLALDLKFQPAIPSEYRSSSEVTAIG